MAILDKKTMIAAANKAAAADDREFFLEREIGDRLMDKLEFIQIEPEVILNIGVRTEQIHRQLSARYPQAQVITVDWAEKALRNIAEAQGGVSLLAKKTQLSRQNLYRVLSGRGNPTFLTLDAIMRGLGFRLSVEPLKRKAA